MESKLLAVATLVLIVGCAPVAPPNFEADAPFTLRAMPMIVLSGGAVRLTCTVPQSSEARRVRLALEGVTASDRPNDRIAQQLLIEHVPCGDQVATCLLSTGERREMKIESRGECNSGGAR